MKYILIASVAIAAVIGMIALSGSPKVTALFQGQVSWKIEQQYLRYMAQKNRVYGTVEEYQNRLAIYASRYVKWELEAVPENKYADWTQEELSGLFGYNADMKKPEKTEGDRILRSSDFDWEDSWNTCDRSILEFPETKLPNEFSWNKCRNNPGIYVKVED